MKKKKRRLKRKFLIILILICLCILGYFGYNKLDTETKYVEKDKVLAKIDIEKIKTENGLDFDIPKEYEHLFRKYANVVENNDKIVGYKKEVYNLFQLLMQESINKYLDEEFFFNKLKDLRFEVVPEILENGANGYYYDSDTTIDIEKEDSIATYHELMHFFDFAINNNSDYNLWECEGKILTNTERNKLYGDTEDDCKYIEAEPAEFIKEAGAELYSAKYFKKGVIAYYDLCAYTTALEYIIGSNKMDELFLGSNTDSRYMKFMLDSGYSVKEYKEIVEELSKYTYPIYYPNVEYTRGKTIDSLIDLYKSNMKGDWTDDEEFKYLLRLFLDMGSDEKYKNSKYKNELDKINYKSYDDFLKREKNMLAQLPNDQIFRVTPIPAYILNDTLYFGTGVRKEGENTENKMAYFKYDFKTKKVTDLKYNVVN